MDAETHVLTVGGVVFSAAHRVQHHPGKCRALHGHNYAVSANITYPQLLVDHRLGYWLDFGEVKHAIKSFCDTIYDHGTILHMEDPLCDAIENCLVEHNDLKSAKMLRAHKPPTAEYFAEEIAVHVCRTVWEILTRDVTIVPADQQDLAGSIVVTVSVQETPNCTASAVFNLYTWAHEDNLLFP